MQAMASHVYTGTWQLSLHQRPLALLDVIQIFLGAEEVLDAWTEVLCHPSTLICPGGLQPVSHNGRNALKEKSEGFASRSIAPSYNRAPVYSRCFLSLLPSLFPILRFTRFVSHLKRHEQDRTNQAFIIIRDCNYA